MRTRLSVMTVVLLTALALGGFARAQAPRRTLVIGMPVTPPNLPHVGVYVAKDLGYFDEEGINVEFAQFESGLQALRGGVAGGLDILGASSEPVIAAISRGAKIRSIFSYAHRLTVVMAAQESIKQTRRSAREEPRHPGGWSIPRGDDAGRPPQRWPHPAGGQLRSRVERRLHRCPHG